MNLTYELSAEDYRIAQRFAIKQHRRGGKGRAWIVNIAIWVVLVVGLRYFLESAPSGISRIVNDLGLVIFFVLLAVFAAMLLVVRKLRRKQVDSLAPFPIAHTLSLHADGMSVANRFCDARYTWIAFAGAEQLPAHVGIAFRASSVMVVPNHAFASQEARIEFVGAIRDGVLQVAA